VEVQILTSFSFRSGIRILITFSLMMAVLFSLVVPINAQGPNLIGEYVFINDPIWIFSDGILTNTQYQNENYTVAILPLKDDKRITYNLNLTVKDTDKSVSYGGPRVIFRYKDDGNYVCFGFFNDGNVHLINRDSSGLSIIKSAPFVLETGKDNIIEITSSQVSVSLKINGNNVMSYEGNEMNPTPPNVGLYSAYSRLEATRIQAFDPDAQSSEMPSDINSGGNPTRKAITPDPGNGDVTPVIPIPGEIPGEEKEPVKGDSIKIASISGNGVFSEEKIILPQMSDEYRTLFLIESGQKLLKKYAFRGVFNISSLGESGHNGVRIIFRYTNDSNYYCVMFNRAGEVSVLKMFNGQWLELTDDIPPLRGFLLNTDEDYRFEILTDPGNVSVRINGKEIMKGPITIGTDSAGGVYVSNAEVTFTELEFVIPEDYVEQENRIIEYKNPGNTLENAANEGPKFEVKYLLYSIIPGIISIFLFVSLILLLKNNNITKTKKQSGNNPEK